MRDLGKALILRWARHRLKKPAAVAAAFSLFGLDRPLIKRQLRLLQAQCLVLKQKKEEENEASSVWFTNQNALLTRLFFTCFWIFPWGDRKVLSVVYYPFLLSKTCVLLIAFELISNGPIKPTWSSQNPCILLVFSSPPSRALRHEVTWPTQHPSFFNKNKKRLS